MGTFPNDSQDQQHSDANPLPANQDDGHESASPLSDSDFNSEFTYEDFERMNGISYINYLRFHDDMT